MRRDELRDQMGMVLQDTWLFGGTIRENIRYGNVDATDEQILAAAKACYVDRFVHSLPLGYDTVLDDEGTSVSAGEKQLLTIARAFLSDPAILILDEATSSVDTRTEVLIQRAMAKLRGGRTSFVIAHRLSTIRDADTILVMDGGRIVEQGSHHELLAPAGCLLRALQRPVRGRRHRRRVTRVRGMADALHDTTWVLDGPIAVPDGVEVVIAFADGTVTGISGCNRFRGTYRHEGQALEFGPLAGTMMMCSPEAMEVERDVLARLAEATRALHDATMLTLLGADDAILLQFSAQSAADLEGTWVVDGIHHPAREAILSTRGELTVQIDDGRISGNGGCNTFHGAVVTTADGITIGPLMSTRKFCDDPDAAGGPTVMEQEAALFAALEHATGHRIEGSRLTLLRPDGGISVTLHRA